MWKPIDGYFWPYRIDEDANVEWLNPKNGKWVRLNPFLIRPNKGLAYGRLCVRLKLSNGKFKNVYVKSLMVDAFFGGKRDGVVYGFKNGSVMDCSVYNLYPTTQDKIGAKSGGGLRNSVEKIDKKGNVLELYASVTEAAEKNFMSRRAVSDRCKNHIQNPFALTGFSFRYEKTRGVDRTIDFVHRES